MRRLSMLLFLFVATQLWAQPKKEPTKAKPEIIDRAITTGGQKVILYKDGTWEFDKSTEANPPVTVTVKTPERPSAEPIGTVNEKYDEFKKTWVYTTKDLKVGEMDFGFLGIVNGGITVTGVSLRTHSEDWQYLKCSSVALLVDGEPVELPKENHDGDVGTGYVTESITVKFSDLKVLEKLAAAKTVKWKVCNDVFEWKPGHITTIYDYLAKLTAKK